MKNVIYITLALVLIFSCTSNKKIIETNNKFGFDYLDVKQEFELKITEFYENTAYCGTEGLPYALLIGETNSDFLPKRVSVLSYCDDRIFKVGSRVKVKPSENPTRITTMNPIFFVKDTIINGRKSKWIIGSENKAIWGNPLILNGCKLRNGKYRIEYDEQYSNYPKIEFIVDNGTQSNMNYGTSEYLIEWISDNQFHLNSIKHMAEPISEFKKQLNTMGEPYYEIISCENETIRFIYRHNLHVIINSGTITRIR